MATMMKVPIAAFANERIVRAVVEEEKVMERMNKWMNEEMGCLNTPSK